MELRFRIASQFRSLLENICWVKKNLTNFSEQDLVLTKGIRFVLQSFKKVKSKLNANECPTLFKAMPYLRCRKIFW